MQISHQKDIIGFPETTGFRDWFMGKNGKGHEKPRLAKTGISIGVYDLFTMFETWTGLEISVYPAPGLAREEIKMIKDLPVSYRHHLSAFCCAVKNNSKNVGCKGHDATITNRRAGERKTVFVQVCHAGVAEAIIPVHAHSRHLATVFVGQAVTPAIEVAGIDEILARTKGLGVDRKQVTRGFYALPRLTEQELERMGLFLDAALRGLAEQIGMEVFEREVLLQNHPHLAKVVGLLQDKKNWNLTEKEVSRQAFLDPSYFSRLFKKIIGKTFTAYVKSKRIDYALRLLVHTDLEIGEITSECGFSRQSYFSRIFKNEVGLTPSDYRKHEKGLAH